MNLEKNEFYELTHPQRRIWYLHNIHSESPLNNIGGYMKIQGQVSLEILEEAINVLIKTNDGLRIRILEKYGVPYQYFEVYNFEKIDFFDFTKYKNPAIEFERWISSTFKKVFTIKDNNLYYFAIYKISESEFGVALKIHHIVADGWSIYLIKKQIWDNYIRILNNVSINHECSYSYVDYIKKEKEYLKSNRFIKNKFFWNEKFAKLPEAFLDKQNDNLKGERVSFNLDNKLTKKILNYTRENKCSLNTFFIIVMLIYINKTRCEDDIILGTPVFNRSGVNEKNTIGMFVSTMPLRIKLNTSYTIKELIKKINSEIKNCFYNQRYPYDILLKDLELGKKGYDSIFDICVNYYNKDYTIDAEDFSVETQEYYNGEQSYSLQMIVKECMTGKITLTFDYRKSKYCKDNIIDMFKYIKNILNQIITNNDIMISKINLLTYDEINQKLIQFNSTIRDYPKDKTICTIFEETVNNNLEKTALRLGNKSLNYKDLNEKVNQLARLLQKKGVGNEGIVAIMASHSFELIIGIMAILKAGGAYLPIDPNYPVDRINYMLKDSNCKLLLSNIDVHSEIEFNGEFISLENNEAYKESTENLSNKKNSKQLAYVIYTSGSTGKPKAAMIEHKGLVNYIFWAQKTYMSKVNETFAFYSSISFDLTITSIFTPLISGSVMEIYKDDHDEFILYKILKENRATIIKVTPSHLKLLKEMDNSKSSIKKIIVGGEDLKVELAKEIYNSFKGNVEIYNEYGPTETVVGCMIHKYDINKDLKVSVPIGVPIDNVQIYILDKYLNVMPSGVAGEIYISGDGVARGYLNKKQLTNEKFIENPFIAGKTMYKTGDKARYIKNGIIEYIGRDDKQVKIRGHRIEIGEIEERLLVHPFVKDAIVSYKQLDSYSILYAYIVAKESITTDELKSWLKKTLPNYMMPNKFIFIDYLPLTANGKVDYDMLPKFESDKKIFINYRNEIEKELVCTIKEVTGYEDISMNDNFYQIGGDSIKAIQISSKLKNKGLNINVKDILAHDLIEEIAASIELDDKKNLANQNMEEGSVESTPIINWFFLNNFNNINHYNQSLLLESNMILEKAKVQLVINKLVEHHDSLRINYNFNTKKLFYNNSSLEERFKVEYIDLSNISTEEQQFNYIEQYCYNIKSSLNIANGGLFKVCVFNLGKNKQVFFFTAHHLTVDGFSWRIILEDFNTAIQQLNNNDTILLPLKTSSFKEWSKYLRKYREDLCSEEEEYWNEVISKKILFLSDKNKSSDTIKSSNIISDELNERDTKSLIEKSNKIYGMTLEEMIIVALSLIIKESTLEKDLVIEIENHGRKEINGGVDVSRTVGWFTNMYPLYLNVINDNLDDNIKSIKEQIRRVPDAGFNYGIFKYLNNSLTYNTEKYIRLNYLGDYDSTLESNGFKLLNINHGSDIALNNQLSSLMDINMMIINKKLQANITYSNNSFNNTNMNKILVLLLSKLREISNYLMNKTSIEFTPSDFEAVDISQEDLDSIVF